MLNLSSSANKSSTNQGIHQINPADDGQVLNNAGRLIFWFFRGLSFDLIQRRTTTCHSVSGRLSTTIYLISHFQSEKFFCPLLLTMSSLMRVPAQSLNLWLQNVFDMLKIFGPLLFDWEKIKSRRAVIASPHLVVVVQGSLKKRFDSTSSLSWWTGKKLYGLFAGRMPSLPKSLWLPWPCLDEPVASLK